MFINKFREEHAQIINTANSSSVITPPIQSARERIPINNQAVLPSLSLVFQRWHTQSQHHVRDRIISNRKFLRHHGSSCISSRGPRHQRSARHHNRARGCNTGPPAFPHSIRSYLQASRHAITFIFKTSATFSSILLHVSRFLRPSRRKLDHSRTTPGTHQLRRHHPKTINQAGSPRPLRFSPVRGAFKLFSSVKSSI